MLRKALPIAFVLVLVSLIGGWATGAVYAKACSAEQGQQYIYEGRYKRAIREFSCLIDEDPTGVEGYRGRIEAQLLLGRYSDAVRDYSRVTAYVLPVHPDAESTILDGYAGRLAEAPQDIPALTGLSFAHWYFFSYPQAIHVLNDLLDVRPDDVYGNLFRGSSRLLKGLNWTEGIQDIEYALSLDPQSPDVRWVIADAYTYGKVHDPQRAFAEASLALDWGLDTPRIHAILASAYHAFGDLLSEATHIKIHIDMVTTEFSPTAPLPAGDTFELDMAAGRSYAIPIPAVAGETIDIATSSPDFYDTIMVLLAPDGSPVVGSDDAFFYLAAFEWVAEESATYTLQVTTFEAVNMGRLRVSRN